MPTYEYACEACGIHFDCKQCFTDEPLETCPECKGSVRRVLYPVGIIFKGSGFYVTDNRSSLSSDIGTSKTKEGDSKPSADTSVEKPSGDKATKPASKKDKE